MDLKDDANALRSRVSALNNEISQGQQAIASLEQDKRDLQSLVEKYQGEISTRKSRHQSYQEQISEAKRVQTEIATLKGVAESTASNVKDANRELQIIKHSLDECSSLVQAKSIDLSTTAGPLDRITGMIIPRSVSSSMRRAREVKKQSDVVQQVFEALKKIDEEIPLLLPGEGSTYLAIAPKDAIQASVAEVSDDDLIFLG